MLHPQVMANRLPWPMLIACMAEGMAWALLDGYGPVYMRLALGEPRLSVVALCTGLMSLAAFFMANIWGRQADKGKPVFGLMRSGLIAAASLTLCFPFVQNSFLYIALCVATSACLAVVAPLSLAWATAQTPEKPGRQASRFYRIRAVGSCLGSFGGSWLVRIAGMKGVLLGLQMTAALFLAGALTLSLTEKSFPDPRTTLTTITPVPESTGAPTGSVWYNPLISAIAITVFFSFGSNETFFSLVGPYYTEYLSGSAAELGITLGIAHIVGLLAVGPVGRLADWRGPLTVFITGVVGYIGVYGLLSIWHQPLAVLILFAVPVYPFMALGATGVLNRSVPPSQRAEAMGAFEGSAALALAGGSLFAGVGTDLLGLATLPLIALALAVIGAAVALLRVVGIARKQTERQAGSSIPA